MSFMKLSLLLLAAVVGTATAASSFRRLNSSTDLELQNPSNRLFGGLIDKINSVKDHIKEAFNDAIAKLSSNEKVQAAHELAEKAKDSLAAATNDLVRKFVNSPVGILLYATHLAAANSLYIARRKLREALGIRSANALEVAQQQEAEAAEKFTTETKNFLEKFAESEYGKKLKEAQLLAIEKLHAAEAVASQAFEKLLATDAGKAAQQLVQQAEQAVAVNLANLLEKLRETEFGQKLLQAESEANAEINSIIEKFYASKVGLKVNEALDKIKQIIKG